MKDTYGSINNTGVRMKDTEGSIIYTGVRIKDTEARWQYGKRLYTIQGC